jgi:hypothetical protein
MNWSDFSVIVLIAHQSGATKSNNMPTDIINTAGARRPPKALCKAISQGHVATTSMVDQTVAARKGRSTHRDNANNPTIQKTASVLRVKS